MGMDSNNPVARATFKRRLQKAHSMRCSGLLAIWLFTGIAFAQSSPTESLLQQAQQAKQQLAHGRQPIAQSLTQGLSALHQAQQQIEQGLAELGPTGGRGGPLTRHQRQQLTAIHTRILFARGELYRQAAATTATDDPTRQSYLDIALEVFGELQSHPLGMIGQAKTYRLMEKFDQARQKIEPLTILLEEPTAGQLALWRMAIIEQLNITLATAPDEALPQAVALLKHPQIKNQPHAQQAVQWIHAQAATQTATSPSQITTAMRSIRLSNPPRRVMLGQLAQLHAISSDPILSSDELNDWVLLLTADHSPAQAVQRIEQLTTSPLLLGPTAVSAYGVALWQSGQLGKAIDAMDKALTQLDRSDPTRALVLQWRASCLYDHAIQDHEPAIYKRAKDALASLVDRDLAQTVRVGALRQWVMLEQQQADWSQTVDQILNRHPQLVQKDSYLRYVRISRQWQQFQALSIADVTAIEAAQRALSQLENLIPLALEQNQRAIAGSAKLLQARIYATAPLHDPASAMKALQTAQQRFGQSDILTFELALLIQTDALPQAIKRFEETAMTQRHADDWVLLANACASEKNQRQRAIDFSRQAWSFTLTSAQRTGLAQTLMRVEAPEVLVDLIAHSEVDGPPGLMLAVGQAMLAVGQRERAVQWIKAATEQLPGSSIAALTLGDAMVGIHQHTGAVKAYRLARQTGTPGKENWWRATIGLCNSLVVLHHKNAARDILRVAQTLYPNMTNPALGRAAEQLNERLSQP